MFGGVFVLVGAFVVYVQLTWKRDFSATALPNIKASNDPAVIAQGEYLVHSVAHCSACHIPNDLAKKHHLPADRKDLRGGYEIKAGPFGTFYTANLTPDPSGIGRRSDPEIARVIRYGVSADGTFAPLMGIAVGPMADEDLVAVVSYLRSLAPIVNETKPDEWGFLAKALSGRFNPKKGVLETKYVPAGGAPSVERGAYLANGPADCGGCHSSFDVLNGFALVGARFAGSNPDPDPTESGYEIVAPNLTPDPETGVLANYTEDAFVDRFKKAVRAVAGSNMPWQNFATMLDADLRSIHRYLMSLPPTKHQVGPSRRKAGWKAG